MKNKFFDYEQDENGIIITRINSFPASGEIIIPEKLDGKAVTTIGNHAFHQSSALRSLYIPASVRQIFGDVLFGCNRLESIEVDPKNKVYKSSEGVLFRKDGKTLCLYPPGKNAAEYIIPDRVTTLSFNSFINSRHLESIIIPKSVRTIKDSPVFEGCIKLRSIEVNPRNPIYKSIDGALFNKDRKSLVCFPRAKKTTDYIIPPEVKIIEYSAFSHCSRLRSIKIPNSVTGIDPFAFQGCTGLLAIQLPDSLTFVGAGLLWDCFNLRSVRLPKCVNGNYYFCFSFFNCGKLRSIELPDNTTELETSIFRGCTSLRSFQIPPKVKIIETHAFLNCSALTNISIPSKVEKILKNVFEDCKSLMRIDVDPKNRKFKSVDGILYNKEGDTLRRFPPANPSSVYKFARKVVSFDEETFRNCRHLQAIETCARHPKFKSIDGVLFSKDGKTLKRYPPGKRTRTYLVPAGVTEIAPYAFADCRHLSSVVLPFGVVKIGELAFTHCHQLTAISLPEGLKIIECFAFQYCDRLLPFAIPESVSKIGFNALPSRRKETSRNTFKTGALYSATIY